MNHSDVRNHMADYLEGDLPIERRALFDAHLDECAECSEEIAEMRGTIALLRGLPDPEPPAGLADDVIRRIRMGEARGGFLDRLSEIAAALFEPKVLAPLSAAMLAAGILIGTGQLRVGGPLPVQTDTVTATPEASERVVAKLRLPRHPGTHVASSSGGEPGRAPSIIIWSGSGAVGPVTGEGPIDVWSQLEEQQRARPPLGLGSGPESLPVATATRRSSPLPSSSLASLLQSSSAAASPDAGQMPDADEWLEFVIARPMEFAAALSPEHGTSMAAQELWVKSLARHAADQGRLDEVVTALRRSTSRSAHHLADDFEAAGRRLGAGAQLDSGAAQR